MNFDQTPPRESPCNLEAEQALLGAILVNNEIMARVNDFLKEEHFFEPLHQRIFSNAARLIDRQNIANPVTLKPFFENDQAIIDIGDKDYLKKLASYSTGIINAVDYGRAIYELALRRSLIKIGEDVVNTAYNADIDNPVTNQIQEAESQLYRLAETGDYEGGLKQLSHGLSAAIASAEHAFKSDGKLIGVSTGFTDLDRLMGGLHRSDLIIIAGRPSMGKTALATNIAFTAASHARFEKDKAGRARCVDGAVVAFFSLEMSAEQLSMRILSEQSRIISERIRRGQLNTSEFHKLVQASQTIENIPLYIDDTPAITITTMRSRARQLKRKHDLGLIVIDYLQLMGSTGRSKVENRVLEISEITRGLKMLAKELNVPVIALSQLSRQVENREDKRPQLADLRESGSIEQDADVVMFVFRESYYKQRSEPREDTPEHTAWREEMGRIHNLADVIIGKQRHGPVGNIKLHFDSSLTLFSNYALSNTDHNE